MNKEPTVEWQRKCQECGHTQPDRKPPTDEASYQRWAAKLCRKCKSPGLDYGKTA